MSKNPRIDYESLVQESLRAVVKQVLVQAAKKGLPGSHHFYISFRTDFPGVDVPDYLREQYPEEITVVLQYEFWDLEVEDDRFFVTLCFNDIHERLTVPLSSIVSFMDPSVKFGLQFVPSIHEEPRVETLPVKAKGKKAKAAETAAASEPDASTNVITLDAFRKNKN